MGKKSIEKDKERIEVKCVDCGETITISYDRFRRRHTKGSSWRCKHCRAIYQSLLIKNRSDDERKAIVDKFRIKQQKYLSNRSEEDKKIVSDKIKDSLNKRSDEEKITHKKNISKSQTNAWRRLNKEQKLIKMIPLFEGNERYKKSINNEERILNSQKISIGLKKYYETRSSEKEDSHNNNISNSIKKYRANLSQEEKDRKVKSLNDGFEKWFSSLNNEEKEYRNKNISNKRIDYYANLTPLEYQEQCRLQAIEFNKQEHSMEKITTTESIFANDLNKHGIEYKYQYKNEILHKDFNKIFSYNEGRDSEFINPFHAWDFIIYTKQDNILVDVDGGKHIIPSNNEIGARIQFNDSQRPYQTDGLDAYIILAYNDNITNDTKVLDIKNNTYITYKNLLFIIDISNLSDKELKKIVRNS